MTWRELARVLKDPVSNRPYEKATVWIDYGNGDGPQHVEIEGIDEEENDKDETGMGGPYTLILADPPETDPDMEKDEPVKPLKQASKWDKENLNPQCDPQKGRLFDLYLTRFELICLLNCLNGALPPHHKDLQMILSQASSLLYRQAKKEQGLNEV